MKPGPHLSPAHASSRRVGSGLYRLACVSKQNLTNAAYAEGEHSTHFCSRRENNPPEVSVLLPRRLRLSQLLDDYLERTRVQIEPSTAYSAAYRMHDLMQAIGDVYADSMTYRDCERFQQWCIDRGLSPSSANGHIKMLRRIFSLAIKRGQLKQNPFDGIRLLKVPDKAVRLYSPAEFERLLQAARSDWWRARILLAKTAGLRRGEILNLTVKDIDFGKGKVVVQAKAETVRTWRWPVKDNERREVPLVQKAADLLAALRQTLPSEQPYFLLSEGQYRYVRNLKDTGMLTDRVAKCPDINCRRSWLLIRRRAGIADATFHDLRGTCITEWLEKGLMPHEVRRLAGHADINTTMRYYVGIRDSLVDRARRASEAALGEFKQYRRPHPPPRGRQRATGARNTAALQVALL